MICRRGVLVILCLFFCSFFLPAALYAEKKPKWIWKTGTLAPKGIGYANQVKDIVVPAVSSATDGDVRLKIYWGGIMGDDKQHLKKMQIGQLQAAGLSGQGTFMMADELPVLGLPSLFHNYEEVDYLKTVMWETFDEIVAKKGLKMLVWLDQDFDQIYSEKGPIQKVSDFPKAKFVTWFGPLEGRLLQNLGSMPTPMDVTEIPASLRSGVCNAMIAPSIWVVGTQLYSTFRYVNPMRIRYVPAFCVCTVKAYDPLPEKYKRQLKEGRLKWSNDFTKGSRVESEKTLEAMLKYGLKKVTTTPEQMEEIKDKSLPIWDQLAGRLYPKELLDEIKAHLADYREKNPRAKP